VLIPFLQKKFSMLDHQGADFGQLVAPEAFRHCQVDRVQPVLRHFVAVFNVDVGRLRPSPLKKKNLNPRTVSTVGMEKV
jgi:hypothetical protein